MRQQPFASPEEALEHFGVKGMRWGVRKKEEPAGERSHPKEAAAKNASTKAFMAASAELDAEAKTLSPEQVDRNLAQAKKKFEAKFIDGPQASRKPSRITKVEPKVSLKSKWDTLSPDQKSAIIKVGGAVVVAGGMAYMGHRNKQAILAMAGKPVSVDQFNKNVLSSQLKTWSSGNFCTKEAYARPAFELPAGHTFFRLTQSEETRFREATYSLHSMTDAERYIANFRHEKGGASLNFVKFTTNSPTKVPDLNTVLSTLKEHLDEAHSSPQSEKAVLRAYNNLSGGTWDSPEAKGLMARLRTKGFGALVDEMDAGVIGDTPLVFFDSQTANPKQISPLTPEIISKAEGVLIELTNRKL